MRTAPIHLKLAALCLLAPAVALIHHFTASASATAISLTTIGTAYTQNFDALASSGTSGTVPAGWAFSESGSSANATYTAGSGTSSTGDTYSFGAAGNPERAFGGLQSSSVIPLIGACFKNETGKTITKLVIAYTGEEWRLGSAGRADRLDFQYSTDATSLTTGTWTDADALDFATPNTATTGAKDGNAAANRTAISATLTGFSIAPGATFFIRWTDFNASGSDDGLAVDDFSITPFTTATLAISDVTVTEGSGGTTSAVLEVTLSEFPGQVVTVDYATANGSATAGSDYTTVNGTLTFDPADGVKVKQIVVPVTADCLIEGSETFTVNLSNAVNAAITKAAGTGTILNDDVAGALQFSAATFSADEGAGTVTITVTRSGGAGESVSVNYATSNGSTSQPSDYTAASGTLTFGCNETTRSFTLTLNDDTLDEADETVNLTLSSPTGGATLGAQSSAVLTIIDDDVAGTVQFSAASFSVDENAGTATITVTRSNGAASGVAVTYATSDGTAQAGLDYTAKSGTVTFGAGETIQTFTIPVSNDNLPEVGGETISLALSNPTGGAALGSPVTAALTIIDDDGEGLAAPGEPFPAEAVTSDQKTGSVLIFPFYSSSIVNPAQENTRFNLTNADSSRAAYVHLFFIESGGQAADSFICLTPNQTATLLASEIDPGESGFLIAAAVDGATGCPLNFNFLIGDEYVKLASGHTANLSAQAFAMLPGAKVQCDVNAVTADLDFDNVTYNAAPRVLALDNIQSPAEGNATLLILDRIGGDLRDRISSIGQFFGLVYDDVENAHSFESSGGAQVRRLLTKDYPRTTPRLPEIIPAGHSGWMRLWMNADRGMIGAVINFNASATHNASAYNQGHNLHALTLTTKSSFTMPVFAPQCQ
ncbi:MAG TPA: Calx-beta domain-containing protein [Blastocatellia bacterium]|nr:Calx-beta domain-containing protein [Blastocatellia bacterium]